METQGSWDLIDTLWNVKPFAAYGLHVMYADLIDTLWNVKFGFRSLSYVIIIDLIDTLWNVKAEGEATRALINAI